ncbi:MAG: DNA polymerase III subunit chi [Variovorax sp.]
MSLPGDSLQRMTEIDFHFNTPDKLACACTLMRKATEHGVRMLVIAPVERLAAIDAALWQGPATDFVTHCTDDAPPSMRSRSAVLILAAGRPLGGHGSDRRLLVNLAEPVPIGFEGFEQLIDIVSTDDADRRAGRPRWQHYSQRGYALRRHDHRQATV